MQVADCSFLRFVYPFTFRPRTFKERVAALDKDTAQWTHRDFPVEETLSHVAGYFKPKEAEIEKQAARQWVLSTQNHNPIRLADDVDWDLSVKGKHPLPFRFGGDQNSNPTVALALFAVGVGFLTVTIRPKDQTIDTWLAFLHHFRMISSSSTPLLNASSKPNTKSLSKFTAKPTTYGEIRDVLLKTATLPDEKGDKDSRWWHDVFVPGRQLPYSALFVDGAKDEKEQAELLYRVRNSFRVEQTVIATDEDLQVAGHPAVLPYTKGQQFLFSLEGGSFMAFDAPANHPFFRETLPSHLRNQYFFSFLLALHQRFALTRLSERVAEYWIEPEDKRYEGFKRLRPDFLALSARSYFVQVMQREHHDRYYRKWHQVLQIDRLYQEVRNEIGEIHEYLRTEQEYLRAEQDRLRAKQEHERAEQSKRAQDVQNDLIARLGVTITLISTLFAFLQIHMKGFYDNGIPPLLVCACVIAIGGLGVFIAGDAIRQAWRSRRGDASQDDASSKPDTSTEKRSSDPDPSLKPRPAILAAVQPKHETDIPNDVDKVQIVGRRAGSD